MPPAEGPSPAVDATETYQSWWLPLRTFGCLPGRPSQSSPARGSRSTRREMACPTRLQPQRTGGPYAKRGAVGKWFCGFLSPPACKRGSETSLAQQDLVAAGWGCSVMPEPTGPAMRLQRHRGTKILPGTGRGTACAAGGGEVSRPEGGLHVRHTKPVLSLSKGHEEGNGLTLRARRKQRGAEKVDIVIPDLIRDPAFFSSKKIRTPARRPG
jgi:hypothetical protein